MPTRGSVEFSVGVFGRAKGAFLKAKTKGGSTPNPYRYADSPVAMTGVGSASGGTFFYYDVFCEIAGEE
jgi:hypothetical protein